MGLDFAAADRERQRLYDNRLEVGRRAHSFGELPKVEKGAPITEVSASAILDRLDGARRKQEKIDALRHEVRGFVTEIERVEADIKRLTQRKAELGRDLAKMQGVLDNLPEPEDTNALRDELASIEDRNRIARENARILRDREAQKAHEETYAELGREIAAIDASKAKAIAAAEMPVTGLGFDDSGVTFGGVPFSQASSAEQIRVSLAMAMALNPSVRVIRIMDGSLLDSDSLAAVREAAAEHDFQIFLEMVGDAETADPASVVISDGSVVGR